MHIFDKGNILLLPEPLHTALQQYNMQLCDGWRECGGRSADSRQQGAGIITSHTRHSGVWTLRQHEQCQHLQTLASSLLSWSVLKHLYLYQLGPIIARLHLWPPELLLKPTANTWQTGTLEMGLGWKHRIVFCIGQRSRDLSSVASNSVHNV